MYGNLFHSKATILLVLINDNHYNIIKYSGVLNTRTTYKIKNST